jgi:putative mRNA 3-end processing factor
MIVLEDKGIKIKQHNFWLDARRKVDFSFVSHGHADHLKNHKTILATPPTVRFHAMRAKQQKAVELEYSTPYFYHDLEIKLYPAGHILGSAMIHITCNDLSLLYTGDFKIKTGLTAEKIQIPKTDILIIESTFGHPDYRHFPALDTLVNALLDFIQDTINRKKLPVVMAYSLGKGQEAMKILSDKGYRVAVHPAIWRFAGIYEEFGITFPQCEQWSQDTARSNFDVLLFPPHLSRKPEYHHIPNKRSVLLSGWAKQGNSFFQCDHQIPLSDHADFDDLISFIKRSGAQKIFTTHGFEQFPAYLREMGFDARLLTDTIQLSFL